MYRWGLNSGNVELILDGITLLFDIRVRIYLLAYVHGSGCFSIRCRNELFHTLYASFWDTNTRYPSIWRNSFRNSPPICLHTNSHPFQMRMISRHSRYLSTHRILECLHQNRCFYPFIEYCSVLHNLALKFVIFIISPTRVTDG